MTMEESSRKMVENLSIQEVKLSMDIGIDWPLLKALHEEHMNQVDVGVH